MAGIIVLAFNVLMLGLIIYWVLNMFFRNSFREEVVKTREFLAGIYEPMLVWVRDKIKPLTGGDSNAFDFSPAVLFIGFWFLKRILSSIFY
ncbi:MAG: YggT family protein [Calditrichia bacterium]